MALSMRSIPASFEEFARRWRPFYFVAGMMGLSACAAQVSDDTDLTTLSKGEQGGVLLLADSTVDECNGVIADIGRADGDHYTKEWRWIVKGNGQYSAKLSVLPAGDYHVLGLTCSINLVRATNIGVSDNPFNSLKPLSYISYASFKVEPGELVNVGLLLIGGTPGNRTLEVRDFPPEVHARLREDIPKIYGKVRARLMSLNPEKTKVEETAAALKLMEQPQTGSSTVQIYIPPYRRH